MRTVVMRSTSAALIAAATLAVAVTTKAQDAQGTNSACTSADHVNFTNQGTGSRPGPATLVPIFWGEPPSNDLTEEEAVWDGVYSQIEQSNYYRWIRSEYGAPELQHVPPTSTLAPGELSGGINQSDIESNLSSWVRSGATPDVSNPVYVLHLPPGVKVNGWKCGYNYVFTSFDLFNGGSIGFYYVVIPGAGTCVTTFDEQTRLLSHEIIESVTDGADINLWSAHPHGWEDPSQPSACGSQIGDLCDGISTVIQSSAEHWVPGASYTHSLIVQKIWSNTMRACVTEDPSTIPTVTSMTAPTMVNGNMPVGGPGTVLTLTGTNLEGVPTVQFGGTTTYDVACPSSTQCTAVAPSGVEGTVQVTFSENGTTLNLGEYTYPPSTAPSCTLATSGCGVVNFNCTGVDSNYALVTQWQSDADTWIQEPFSSAELFTEPVPETVRFCYGSYAGVLCGSPITFTPDVTGLINSCAGKCGTISNGCGGTLDCGTCAGPTTCNGQSKPTTSCRSSRGWVCCGDDGWECSVCQ
jgi:hypothetical protein